MTILLNFRFDDMEWISVKDMLPEQTEYMTDKFKGTREWGQLIVVKGSDTVIIVLENEHERIVTTGYLLDGKWKTSVRLKDSKVTYWMPFPSPPAATT